MLPLAAMVATWKSHYNLSNTCRTKGCSAKKGGREGRGLGLKGRPWKKQEQQRLEESQESYSLWKRRREPINGSGRPLFCASEGHRANKVNYKDSFHSIPYRPDTNLSKRVVLVYHSYNWWLREYLIKNAIEWLTAIKRQLKNKYGFLAAA